MMESFSGDRSPRLKSGFRERRLRSILLVASVTATVSFPSATHAGEGRRGRGRAVMLYVLGNESVALEAGGRTVLIDALQTVGSASNGDVPFVVYEKMLERKKPFADVPLALVSHPHPDHHHPSVASEFLRAHPECLMAATSEVLSSVAGDSSPSKTQLLEIKPRRGQGVKVEHDGIEVTFFELPHLSFELYQVRVVAHLVRHGGLTVLHVGDSDLTPETLADLRLAERDIDVALVPYWVFTHPAARSIIDKHIGAKRIVVMRLPLGGMAEARQTIKTIAPNAAILIDPLKPLRL
jgi:L-ascorbate metabolism protein UlaG (beta-lactamase superfamily)